jgi:hypothetical protein
VPERLVVVSNRLPVTMRRSGGRWVAERSSGGLVAALGPVLERGGGLWIGWPGASPDGPGEDRAVDRAVDLAGNGAGDPVGNRADRGATGGLGEVLRALERDQAMASVELPAAISRAF